MTYRYTTASSAHAATLHTALVVALVLIAMVLTACGPTKVIRDATTFEIETMAALARQAEAATALHLAADRAGDYAVCVEYAQPALVIDAYAENQAKRALWLAGLSEGADPGPSPAVASVDSVCGPEPTAAVVE